MLYKDASPTAGFLILPDMKWDLQTVGTLYLVALVLDRRIRSLRDLKKAHVPMLREIMRRAREAVERRWGLRGAGALRFYVHYQPSYCESPNLNLNPNPKHFSLGIFDSFHSAASAGGAGGRMRHMHKAYIYVYESARERVDSRRAH